MDVAAMEPLLAAAAEAGLDKMSEEQRLAWMATHAEAAEAALGGPGLWQWVRDTHDVERMMNKGMEVGLLTDEAMAVWDDVRHSHVTPAYHHVRWSEQERGEQWFTGALRPGFLSVEARRAQEAAEAEHVAEHIVPRVQDKLQAERKQLASELGDALREASPSAMAAGGADKAVSALGAAEQAYSEAVAAGHKERDAFTAALRALESSAGWAPASKTEPVAVQLRSYLHLGARATAEAISQRVELGLAQRANASMPVTPIDPTEEYMMHNFDSFEDYARFARKVQASVTEKLPATRLPRTLDADAPRDLQSVARALEDNPSINAQSAAEMLQLYADMASKQPTDGELVDDGVWVPANAPEEGAPESPAEFAAPEHLSEPQSMPWRVKYPAPYTVDQPDLFKGVDPAASYEEGHAPEFQYSEDAAPLSPAAAALPPQILDKELAGVLNDITDPTDLAAFIEWANSEFHGAEAVSSDTRGRSRSRRGRRASQ